MQLRFLNQKYVLNNPILTTMQHNSEKPNLPTILYVDFGRSANCFVVQDGWRHLVDISPKKKSHVPSPVGFLLNKCIKEGPGSSIIVKW